MRTTLLTRLLHLAHRVHAVAQARVARWLRPVPLALGDGVMSDAMRSRSELVLENAPLRHQLVVLSRAATRPRLAATNRGLLIAGSWCSWPAGCAPGPMPWSSCAPRPCCAGIARATACSGGARRGDGRPYPASRLRRSR